ncbi:MAG TPA: sugar ABC transporter ATP-binding protein [Anaeromyxobacter sp.]|nr:sugar ABC transporter ATP-binding protein [Anaeromyxobacter sp.]
MGAAGEPGRVVLSARDIEKSFPGVKALKGVSVDFRAGQIHAVCGENGAGKSTLMHVLAGAYPADSGTILYEGKPITLHTQHQANTLGIAIVYQERSLVPGLTVGENIFAGRQPRRLGLVDWRAVERGARQTLAQLGLEIDPRQLVVELPAALQQMVEIAKALSVNPRVLILDEPTATVTQRESEVLFGLLRRLRDGGLAIVYISHRLAEIFQIADHVTVLKDGAFMGTEEVSKVDEKWLIKRMVGRELYVTRAPSPEAGERILEVEGLSDGDRFREVGFHLRAGEILGFSGLVGAGRTEVFQTLFGLRARQAGRVRLFGKPVRITSPREAIALGLGYLPEDRKEQGLFVEMAVCDNIVAAALDRCRRFIELDRKKVLRFSEEYRSRLSIATPSVEQKVLNLSGGNQQKVVLAKWLLVNPRILVVDEPTRGVDVGAKLEIYSILRQLREGGTSIVVISSDLPEILSIADRIYVMCEGRIAGEIQGSAATEESLLSLSSRFEPPGGPARPAGGEA